MAKTDTRKLFAALLCGGLLSLGSAAVEARDDGRWGHPGKGWGHYEHKHHAHPPHFARDRVIVYKERHHYRAPRVIHHYHHDYDYGYPRYGYYESRRPAVVISLPPVIIPLR